MVENMTQGNIKKQLFNFAVPLVLGNLFQLTYNAADSIIVGKFAGEAALAAVGTSNPIMNITLFFIIGICLGASVLMSEFYGAGENKKLKREISTTIIIGSIFTIVIAILGYIFAPFLLRIIRTPAEIIDMAVSYLRIIFCGLMFTFFYNVFAASLKSVGDSKTPIYFLIISSIINICLDLLFVGGMKLSVKGAGLATIIAEAVSCILCIIYIYKKYPLISIKPRELIFDKTLIGKTVSYSWATAMQQTVLQIGKVFIQGAVNPLGVDAIAAFNAVNRVDDFAFMPQQSIAQAMTVFLAQNRGAGKKDRIKQGFKDAMILELGYFLLLLVTIFFGARTIMGLFVDELTSNIVPMGTAYLKLMAVFYIMPAVTNGIQGYFRGMGNMKVTFYSTTVQMIFRVLLVYIIIPVAGFSGIAFACAGGWIAMLLYEVPLYIKDIKTRTNTEGES